MRVLLVTHYYASHGGGVEIVAGQLGRRLRCRGIELRWAASELRGEPPDGEIPRLPMPAWNVTERRLGFPYPLWGPGSLLRLWREVGRCDVVHLHDSLYMGNAAAWLWARLRSRPIVLTQHIGLVPYSRRLLRALHSLANRTLARAIMRGSDRVVFLGPKVYEYFSGLFRFRRQPLLIPNGVDGSLFTPVDGGERRRLRLALGFGDGAPVMLFVGRFVEKKGMRRLAELARRFRNCLWVFVGWGADDPAGWGLANVRSLGRLEQERMPDVYRAADLLVLPSLGEGFPLVVQEAIASGLPVLISDDTARGAAGVESVAWTAPASAEAFAERLRALLDRPEELAARRPTVADFAHRHWSWERCADRYHEILAEVAGAPGP